MTSDHLIPFGDCSSDPVTYSILNAEILDSGVCVRTIGGVDMVLSIERSFGKGLYTAVVDNEFLVLNGGVIASAYNRNHGMAKAFYSMYRFAYYIAPTLMTSNGFAWLHGIPTKLDFLGQYIPASFL